MRKHRPEHCQILPKQSYRSFLWTPHWTQRQNRRIAVQAASNWKMRQQDSTAVYDLEYDGCTVQLDSEGTIVMNHDVGQDTVTTVQTPILGFMTCCSQYPGVWQGTILIFPRWGVADWDSLLQRLGVGARLQMLVKIVRVYLQIKAWFWRSYLF